MKLIILLAVVGFAVSAPQRQNEPKVVNLRPAIERIAALIDFQSIADALSKTDLTTCEHYKVILEYLHGPKFATIHSHLWTDSEFLDVIKFISESGFPEIYDLFNQAFELLKLPFRVGPDGPINPTGLRSSVQGTEPCNETALAHIVSNAIPQAELMSLALDLLNNDENVRALFYKLSEPEKAESYKRMKNLPEVQELIQAARDTGIQIDTMLALVEAIMGYTSTAIVTAVDLRPAFERVKSLIDVYAIAEAIAQTDLTTCKNYAAIREYLDGPKFETIHNHLWTDAEFLDVTRFLFNSGFPEVYDFVNSIFELLRLPYRVGPNGPIGFQWALRPRQGSEQCDEEALAKIISDAIPQTELLGLALELINTDQNVQAFFFKISEPGKAESYRRTKNLPEVQDLIQAARDAGIEIDAILSLLEAIFGYAR